MRTNRKWLVLTVPFLFIWVPDAMAYSEKTHRAVSEEAVTNLRSTVGGYLQTFLGLKNGLLTNVALDLDQTTIEASDRIPYRQLGKRLAPNYGALTATALEFLELGGALEDAPLPRARHHFHAPVANVGMDNPDAGLDNQTDHPAMAVEFNLLTGRLFPDYSFDLTGASAMERALETENKMRWQYEYWNYFSWPDTRKYLLHSLTEQDKEAREHYFSDGKWVIFNF